MTVVREETKRILNVPSTVRSIIHAKYTYYIDTFTHQRTSSNSIEEEKKHEVESIERVGIVNLLMCSSISGGWFVLRNMKDDHENRGDHRPRRARVG